MTNKKEINRLPPEIQSTRKYHYIPYVHGTYIIPKHFSEHFVVKATRSIPQFYKIQSYEAWGRHRNKYTDFMKRSNVVYGSITIHTGLETREQAIKVSCYPADTYDPKASGNPMMFWYELKGDEVSEIPKLWKEYLHAMTLASGLKDRAMLVSVNTSLWTGNVTDKEASQELRQKKDVKAHKAASVRKILLPSNEHLKRIKKIAGLARNKSYKITFAWTEKGRRVLPTRLFAEHSQEMAKYKAEFDHEVELMLRGYDDAVQEAKQELGQLWNQDDYPTTDELRAKFSFDVSTEPIPDASAFTVMLSPADFREIEKQLEEKAKQAAEGSRKELYERLHKLVNHMADKLSDPEAKFKNSLTENIKELTALTKDLNITRDDNLNDLAEQCKELGEHDPDKLRNDPVKREEVAEDARQKAKQIEDRMNIFKN